MCDAYFVFGVLFDAANTTLAFIRLRITFVENNSPRIWLKYESDKGDLWQDSPAPHAEVAGAGAEGLPIQALFPTHRGSMIMNA